VSYFDVVPKAHVKRLIEQDCAAVKEQVAAMMAESGAPSTAALRHPLSKPLLNCSQSDNRLPRTVPSYELSGVAVVGAGSFNPAILHPRWLAENGLIAQNEAEHALENTVVSSQLTAFTADWLSVQAVPEQAVFSTVEEARELELRDAARGVLDLLPHTPVDGLGINADAHYRLDSEEEWHAVGDLFAPKDFWEPLFAREEWIRRENSDLTVGLRTLRVETWRANRKDYVRVEVAPSTRIVPFGVYVGINAHFQFSDGDERGTGTKRLARSMSNGTAFERLNTRCRRDF
jgi:hypothetical protein